MRVWVASVTIRKHFNATQAATAPFSSYPLEFLVRVGAIRAARPRRHQPELVLQFERASGLRPVVAAVVVSVRCASFLKLE